MGTFLAPTVSPAVLAQAQEVISAVVASGRLPQLLSWSLSKADLLIPVEREAIEAAHVASNWDVIKPLICRPGRLFYALAAVIQDVQATLGMPAVAIAEGVEPSPIDRTAQVAWQALETGAETVGMGAYYDPVGALSGGPFFCLDSRGLHALHGDTTSFPIFGVLAREDAGRLARYNAGLNDRVGDVSLGLPESLRMRVVPAAYAPYLREQIPLQYVAPASVALAERFTPDWATSLPTGAHLVTGIKGLPNGLTPLEYIRNVLAEAGRTVFVTDVLGYAPAKRWMGEVRRIQQEGGQARLADPWKIVLATNDRGAALRLARRWAGQGARERQPVPYRGVELLVVESTTLNPPLKITIITDPDVIRTNELASIYKNLEAIELGRRLFEAMHQAVRAGRKGDHALYAEFAGNYHAWMVQAQKDIEAVLELEGIPSRKRVILGHVLNDLYGSWRTEHFEALFQLVRAIFSKENEDNKEAWAEAMVLLKLRTGDHYSVRNPCYGFCRAADLQAVLDQYWLTAEEVRAATTRLRAEGLLRDQDPDPVLPEVDPYFFTMIPMGLLPEGLDVAGELPNRYSRADFKRLPDTFRQAYLVAQRLQNSSYLPPKLVDDLIDVSESLATFDPNGPSETDRDYPQLFGRLHEVFTQMFFALMQVFSSYPVRQGEFAILIEELGWLLERMRDIDRSLTTSPLSPEALITLNQRVLELLTQANRIYVLPPEEGEFEKQQLREAITTLVNFATHPDLDRLFPRKIADPESLVVDLKVIESFRGDLFRSVATGLVQLTHDMSKLLHTRDRAVDKKSLCKAVEGIRSALYEAGLQLGQEHPMQGLFSTVDILLEGIIDHFAQKRSSPGQRVQVFVALIETLVHARRFFIVSADRAAQELEEVLERFVRVSNHLNDPKTYLSPLWRATRNGTNGVG